MVSLQIIEARMGTGSGVNYPGLDTKMLILIFIKPSINIINKINIILIMKMILIIIIIKIIIKII